MFLKPLRREVAEHIGIQHEVESLIRKGERLFEPALVRMYLVADMLLISQTAQLSQRRIRHVHCVNNTTLLRQIDSVAANSRAQVEGSLHLVESEQLGKENQC